MRSQHGEDQLFKTEKKEQKSRRLYQQEHRMV